MGVIRDKIFHLNKNESDNPLVVLVEIFKYTGTQFFEDKERHNWVPLVPHRVYNKYFNVTRVQFSFKVAFAITIHKSQGIFNFITLCI